MRTTFKQKQPVARTLFPTLSIPAIAWLLFFMPMLIAIAPIRLSADPIVGFVREPVFGSHIYLEEYGKGKPQTIVLVHGAGELGTQALAAAIDALENQYHIIRFDLPGFGRSEKTCGLYSMENYARFLKWIIDTYAAGQVYLVGHSLGGAIALFFAGTYPQALERLILIDVAGILHRATYTKTMVNGYFGGELKLGDRNLIEKPVASLKNLLGTAIDHFDSRWLPDNLHHLLQLETFRRTVLKADPNKIAAMAMIYADFSSVIAAIDVPTQIIWGEVDDIAPLRTGHLLACAIEQSSLTVLSGRGHTPMIEDPAAFNAVLLQSIADPGLTPYPKITRPARPSADLTATIVKNQDTGVISGNYRSITIENCRGVTVKKTYANEIIIRDSEVFLINTWVEGARTGMEVSNSTVYCTGATITGQTALQVSNSNLDIAGSSLKADQELLITDQKATAVFSVSKVDSPGRSGFVHRIITLEQGSSF